MKLEMFKETECVCDHCVRCCTIKPGWFKPGEVEKVAEYLKMTVQELFEKYLGVDWWVNLNDSGDVFLLSPATVDMTPGQEFPRNPRGTCVFLKDDRCTIHPVKPYECRIAHHSRKSMAYHKVIAEAWLGKQESIEEILGREPEAREFGVGSWLDGFLGDDMTEVNV